MRLFSKIAAGLVLAFCLIGEGQALVLSKNTELVTARLFTEYDQAGAEAVELLVKLEIKKGWHIYGNPAGEAAKPTEFDWNGAEVDLLWQSASKEFNFEGFQQFGYEDEAYYKFRLNRPAERVRLDVAWLACDNQECVPDEASFEFGLPFGSKEMKRDLRFDLENKKALESFAEASAEGKPAGSNFLGIILMAFLGGIILNFMPCIFPILSIKAIALVQNINKHKKARAEAVFYSIGVICSFFITASILIFLRMRGEAIGWGFQLQSPIFVLVMIVIFFMIFLLLLDVIHIKNPLINAVGRVSFARQKLNAFVTGFFAVLIASPCTAPFMGIAIGYTLSQPVYVYYPVFLALGAGYALPFALIGFFPKALSVILPKPGRWMVILKRLFALPILLTCLWLVWVLYAQVHSNPGKNALLDWEVYEEQTVEALVEAGKPVFVDFTAKWCITCLANERLVLETEAFAALAKEKGVVLFKADWTLQDEKIAKALEKYGRASIPLYVYCENKECVVLPQILSFEGLKKEIATSR